MNDETIKEQELSRIRVAAGVCQSVLARHLADHAHELNYHNLVYFGEAWGQLTLCQEQSFHGDLDVTKFAFAYGRVKMTAALGFPPGDLMGAAKLLESEEHLTALFKHVDTLVEIAYDRDSV